MGGVVVAKLAFSFRNKLEAKRVTKCPLLEEKNWNLSTVVQSPRRPKSSAIHIRTCNRHNKEKTHLTYVFSLLFGVFVHLRVLTKQDLNFIENKQLFC